jgi:excinuclease UvrABC nuclease subunit
MASPGVYLFKRNGYIVYVGRGIDVYRRVPASYRQGKYDREVQVIPTTCERNAYLLECELYHQHDPCDNQIHPAVPFGTNWRCPIDGCDWS